MLRLKSKRRFASCFVFVLICFVLNLTASHANCCLYIPSTVVPTGLVSRQRKVAWQTWTQIFARSSSRVQLTSTTSHIWGLVMDFRSSKTCQRQVGFIFIDKSPVLSVCQLWKIILPFIFIWFSVKAPCDWVRDLGSFSQPIRGKTKGNRNLLDSSLVTLGACYIY